MCGVEIDGADTQSESTEEESEVDWHVPKDRISYRAWCKTTGVIRFDGQGDSKNIKREKEPKC